MSVFSFFGFCFFFKCCHDSQRGCGQGGSQAGNPEGIPGKNAQA